MSPTSQPPGHALPPVAPSESTERERKEAEAAARAMKDTLAVARLRLSSGQPEEALELLAPFERAADAPSSVLMALANIWRQLADTRGDADCLGETAALLSRVQAREPNRRGLHQALGLCLMEQATRSPEENRPGLLDGAARHLGAAANEEPGDVRLLTDLGRALMLRATSSGSSADNFNESAEAAFRRALDAGAGADSQAAWLLQWMLRQWSARSPAQEGGARRSRALAIIQQVDATVGLEASSPMWQASAIQAEVEDATAGKPGVARRVRLKDIRARHGQLLAPGAAIPIVFAWINLLCAEATELMGNARRAKYAEAQHALELARPAADIREEMELQLLTSMIGRKRGHLEDPAVRLILLGESEKALRLHLDHPDAAKLRMEAALVSLEQATLLRAPASRIAARKVVSLTASLIRMPSLEAEALQCELQARLLMEEEDSEASGRMCRLIELAPHDPATWVIAARHALCRQEHASAVEHCETALRCGAQPSALVPLWTEILAHQNEAGVQGTLADVATVVKRLRTAGVDINTQASHA